MTCPRCGGADGAHYAACTLGTLFSRWLGEDYPLFRPETAPPVDSRLTDEEISRIGQQYMAGSGIYEQIASMRHDLDAAIDAITRPTPGPRTREETEQLSEAMADQLAGDEPEQPAPVSAFMASRQDREPSELAAAAKPKKKRGTGWTAEHAAKIGVPGAFAQPETVAAEAAAQEYIDTHLVASTKPRTTIQKTAGPREWVPGFLTPADLMAGYLAWAEANDKPVIKATERLVGQAATKSPLVTKKRQGPVVDDKKPICYFGVELLESPPAPTPEPSLDEQMAQRRAAEEAARAAMPAAATFVTADRYRYTGPRPGKEIPPEFRDMLEPLWSVPGWSYAPRNDNGGGKPRVITPAGTGYTIPNTPSDVRAVKNARAALRRLGAPL